MFDTIGKIAATFALLGCAVVLVGIVCGMATGFTNNWALKVAVTGVGMAIGAIVLGIILAVVGLWR